VKYDAADLQRVFSEQLAAVRQWCRDFGVEDRLESFVAPV
jgi:hypothetical protein